MTSAREDTAREQFDQYCLSDAQVDALLFGAPWRRFLVLGDSIAEGVREPSPGYRDVSWAERVAEALRRQHRDAAYLNLAQRGMRAGEVRKQQLAQGLEFAPDLAAIVAGGNDVLAGSYDGDSVEADLDFIITALADAGADVITFTMLDITKVLPFPPEAAAQLLDLAQRSRALARRHSTVHVDLYDEPFCADPDIYASDLQHATARGHAICAALTTRALSERLRDENVVRRKAAY